jgi:hypothetical protein
MRRRLLSSRPRESGGKSSDHVFHNWELFVRTVGSEMNQRPIKLDLPQFKLEVWSTWPESPSRPLYYTRHRPIAS